MLFNPAENAHHVKLHMYEINKMSYSVSLQSVHKKSHSQVKVTLLGHFLTDDVDCALTQVWYVYRLKVG